jgi:quercetin dioxygenase-like cupin family protein
MMEGKQGDERDEIHREPRRRERLHPRWPEGVLRVPRPWDQGGNQRAVNAHVIRARPGEKTPGEWHRHDLDFQMVYVLRGWVRFEYEGVGEVLLRPGSCVHQPAGILHREIEHSDDLEMLEITSPAEFGTEAAEGPGS